jgi:hypothetical protein
MNLFWYLESMAKNLQAQLSPEQAQALHEFLMDMSLLQQELAETKGKLERAESLLAAAKKGPVYLGGAVTIGPIDLTPPDSKRRRSS